jgi:hypothetical protein
MSRQTVRELKRAYQSALSARGHNEVLAGECALLLLERSIRFGHSKLAVIRLCMAFRAGADIPAGHWDYCRDAVDASRDPTLKALFSTMPGAVQKQPPAVARSLGAQRQLGLGAEGKHAD